MRRHVHVHTVDVHWRTGARVPRHLDASASVRHVRAAHANDGTARGITGPGSSRVTASSTGRMLTVAAQLDLLPGLFAVFAAIFPEGTVRLHRALTGGMRALACVGHDSPP